MKKYYLLIIALLSSVVTIPAWAQQERTQSIIQSYLHGWEYSLKAGFSIGGTSPLPLPVEIRSIDGYSPSMAISIEGNTTKWLDAKKYGDLPWTTPGEQEYDNRSYGEEL